MGSGGERQAACQRPAVFERIGELDRPSQMLQRRRVVGRVGEAGAEKDQGGCPTGRLVAGDGDGLPQEQLRPLIAAPQELDEPELAIRGPDQRPLPGRHGKGDRLVKRGRSLLVPAPHRADEARAQRHEGLHLSLDAAAPVRFNYGSA